MSRRNQEDDPRLRNGVMLPVLHGPRRARLHAAQEVLLLRLVAVKRTVHRSGWQGKTCGRVRARRPRDSSSASPRCTSVAWRTVQPVPRAPPWLGELHRTHAPQWVRPSPPNRGSQPPRLPKSVREAVLYWLLELGVAPSQLLRLGRRLAQLLPQLPSVANSTAKWWQHFRRSRLLGAVSFVPHPPRARARPRGVQRAHTILAQCRRAGRGLPQSKAGFTSLFSSSSVSCHSFGTVSAYLHGSTRVQPATPPAHSVSPPHLAPPARQPEPLVEFKPDPHPPTPKHRAALTGCAW